jgi:hypothetical protein
VPKTIWQPHPGSQRAFLECPYWEVLYHGTRGPGKTDALLMDYLQHVGEGWGASWRGILFRKTYKQLSDVIARTKRWFPRIFTGARYNAGAFEWTFPEGEQLLLRYMRIPDDYWEYHGHEYPWIGWEELTRWPTMECYEMMLACSRSSTPDMPRKVRSTANPYGIGHNSVKRYFVDKSKPCEAYVTQTGDGRKLKRTHVFGSVEENVHLTDADPEYIARLDAIQEDALKRAWRHGDWDIVAGGAFDDVWDRKTHVVEPFVIPNSWRVDRGFDWGSTSPFSVLWYARSDGTDFDPNTGKRPAGHGAERRWYPRGTLFVIGEWYGGDENEKGLKMSPRDIAVGIVEIEASMDDVVSPGPADNQIFDAIPGRPSIAEEMESAGVTWERSNKSPGSRIRGFELLRSRLGASKQEPMNAPGFFVFNTCPRYIDHIPVLERDEKNIHDVDSDQPDHDYDNSRYRVLADGASAIATEII